MLTENGEEIGRTFQVTEKMVIVTGGGVRVLERPSAPPLPVSAHWWLCLISTGEGSVVSFRNCSLLVYAQLRSSPFLKPRELFELMSHYFIPGSAASLEISLLGSQ